MSRYIVADAHGNALYSGEFTQAFEDTSFIEGDSPVSLDVNAALGHNAHDGYVVCDGAGNMTVAFSPDGTTFGDEATLKNGETISLEGLNIDTIRITWATNSAYRVFVV